LGVDADAQPDSEKFDDEIFGKKGKCLRRGVGNNSYRTQIPRS